MKKFVLLMLMCLGVVVNSSALKKQTCNLCNQQTVSISTPTDVLFSADQKCLFVASQGEINSSISIFNIINCIISPTPNDSVTVEGNIQSLALSPSKDCVIAFSFIVGETSLIGKITIFRFDPANCMFVQEVQAFSFSIGVIFAAISGISLATAGNLLALPISGLNRIDVFSFEQDGCTINTSPAMISLPADIFPVAVTFTKDSTFLAVASRTLVPPTTTVVSVYNTADFSQPTQPPLTFNLDPNTIRFSPDERCFSMLLRDETTQLLQFFNFDKTNGTLIPTVVQPVEGALFHTYSPDGRCLAVGTTNGTIELYNLCRNSCDIMSFSRSIPSLHPAAIEYSPLGGLFAGANFGSNSIAVLKTKCKNAQIAEAKKELLDKARQKNLNEDTLSNVLDNFSNSII